VRDLPRSGRQGQHTHRTNLHLKDLGSDEVQNRKNAELQKIIVDGKGAMPAYKDKLDQASTDAVIAFIRTLKK
jgi:mono/diheme cytochrome c family protein